MMNKIRSKVLALLFLWFVLFFARPASADLVIVGEIIAVISGDTMKILWTGGIEMIRLADVDCPKKDQPYGEEAKMFTEDHTIARTVIVTIKGVDPFGRSIGEVFLENGKSLNQELVKNGLARWRQKHLEAGPFAQLELEAKGQKIGLWQD